MTEIQNYCSHIMHAIVGHNHWHDVGCSIKIEMFIMDTIFKSHLVEKIVLKTMVQIISCYDK